MSVEEKAQHMKDALEAYGRAKKDYTQCECMLSVVQARIDMGNLGKTRLDLVDRSTDISYPIAERIIEVLLEAKRETLEKAEKEIQNY